MACSRNVRGVHAVEIIRAFRPLGAVGLLEEGAERCLSPSLLESFVVFVELWDDAAQRVERRLQFEMDVTSKDCSAEPESCVAATLLGAGNGGTGGV
mmetsp:Transcript_31496/g.86686  ORF Transcript_31496/g.86686 Transcript_31496/m.86686 type:complete len:97 (-) Transcript_31496:238-528(-)